LVGQSVRFLTPFGLLHIIIRPPSKTKKTHNPNKQKPMERNPNKTHKPLFFFTYTRLSLLSLYLMTSIVFYFFYLYLWVIICISCISRVSLSLFLSELEDLKNDNYVVYPKHTSALIGKYTKKRRYTNG